ncbi:hypothetical protein BDV59DRAFT_24028 [Aspergillus ambiguus]|uniref:uncharacterized protein n=1 Tax=Aspergillus ambiguus TaxID=176160 RepID=UPI003CCE3001
MEDPPYEPQEPDLRRPYSPAHEPPDATASTITQDLVHYDEPSQVHGEIEYLAQDCGYNSSASSVQQSSSDLLDDDEDEHRGSTHSRASSHSSVSSIPNSVLTHNMEGFKAFVMRETTANAPPPSTPRAWDDRDAKGYSRILHTVRQREAAFRKPSSVRAMQMHTEDEGDDEFLTPPKRKAGHRFSDISLRSAGSGTSPLKRSPYYSPTGSLGKPKPKKEYPLVLLHCNLLPPSLPVPGLLGYPDQKILQDVLPPEYWRRWKRLEEKVGSGVLRDRGVLISHPEDMYDVLEERLLESLELQRPRLDHGHFLGHDADEEKEGHSTTDDEEGEECPDCGGRVVHQTSASRKWEIRVFAANGLMKAGAWAAAWKEMEKVDVEVGLWLPSEVRRELEKRLLDSQNNSRMQTSQLQGPVSALPQSLENPRLRGHTPLPAQRSSSSASGATMRQEQQGSNVFEPMRRPAEIDLQTLLVNYIRVLAADRRNVAIVVLSILVVFFAIDFRPRAAHSELRLFPQEMADVGDHPVLSLAAPSSTIGLASSVSADPISDASQSSVVVASTSVLQGDNEDPTPVMVRPIEEETAAFVEEPSEPVATFVGFPLEEHAFAEIEKENSSINSRMEADPKVEIGAADPPGFGNLGDSMMDLEHDARTDVQHPGPVND